MTKFKFNQKPKTTLVLDKDFTPIILGNLAFEEAVHKTTDKIKIKIAIERNNKQVSVEECFVFHDSKGQEEANFRYLERLVKTLLWLKGGYKIYIGGNNNLALKIQKYYSNGFPRSFDRKFMSNVYENEFEVIACDMEDVPDQKEQSKPVGRHLDGYRIGFDAGGSDRKVSAVINGKAIYSEEVVWYPKINSNPQYHYQGVMDSLKKAASKLPQVDAIGVSSAGIFVDNRVAVASLFRKVPQELFDQQVRDMYLNIQKEFNNVPIEVVNDGDVTALAGAMSMDSNNVLGIAMGTSEAVGYVDGLGNITGWLNELCFVPVDYNQESMIDEWSGDYGVGVTYFSQDAVIKLANPAGIVFEEDLSPAEKLKVVQQLVSENHEMAKEIFKTIGVYLGYEIAYYARFYDINHVLILGRVTSGIGGDIIIAETNNILKNEFTELYNRIKVSLPDEKSRRVGQSIAAASLPKI